ncbi:hypothetical protein Htur_3721 [Haloterrigena turkmenica DSM 5511]|uniref:Uncharacterized protein n=1 Tax=Haloterrigena turkmenica (strain ATCC 51198 / DSM 5511 / JCM 9101 / NCIMB 13204 / VKM B-1734 / 4k) TaxID=543526 RepID=D2RRW6_HALTV|nr:hypothetical protein [Haloterrigena turkmenica]ADB62583.1 hypothetical protein Htur_3721 [Haloterrigena turkmenica DSM 5511]
MGGELSIRVDGERTPPPVEGLDAEDGVWRLSLEPHRDLLVDITGVEPTDEFTRRELETVRARLEGYVEREKRTPDESAGRANEAAGDHARSPVDRLRRLLALLVGRVPLVGTVTADRDSSDRRTDAQRSYSPETAQQLARVFRAAIDDRQREIPEATGTVSVPAATTGSSANASAD